MFFNSRQHRYYARAPKEAGSPMRRCAFHRRESETPSLQVAWQGRRELFPRAVMQLPYASKLPHMHRAFATQLLFRSLVVCTIHSALAF